MTKIKNDPSKYVKRSDLETRAEDGEPPARSVGSSKRAREFMTAPIDRSFYMDLSPAVPRAGRRFKPVPMAPKTESPQ